jgi:hypothetical protein
MPEGQGVDGQHFLAHAEKLSVLEIEGETVTGRIACREDDELIRIYVRGSSIENVTRLVLLIILYTSFSYSNILLLLGVGHVVVMWHYGTSVVRGLKLLHSPPS